MQEKDLSRGYYQRFPVLSWLGILFCFVLFPAGLISLGLDHLLKVRAANQSEEIASRLETALKTVEQFSDNEYFTHFLLLEMNQQLLASQQPKETFLKLKTRLQKKHPDTFTFIYWDGRGELDKELSDETSYGYIIKRTWQFLKRASEFLGRWDEVYEQATLGNLADIDKEAKILRNFLGKLLVGYQLRYPWMSGQLGRPLQTAPPGPRSRIWYRINDNFGFLCFINDRFIRSKAGTEYALNILRKSLPEITLHLSDYPASEAFFPPAESRIAPKLIQALSRFENMSPARLEEFDDILVSCRMVGQSQRAVAYCSSDLHFSAERERKHYLGKAARMAFPLLFILMVWYKTRWSGFSSIRLKLTVIFLYAGGIPLLIMGSIGLEYLDQKKQQLIYESQTRGINVLYSIDRNFQVFLEDHAAYLSEFINGCNGRYGLGILGSEPLQSIRSHLMTFSQPESIQLYNEKGQNLIEDNKQTFFSDYTITSQIAMEILKSLSRSVGHHNKNSLFMAEKLGVNAVSKKREISFWGLGAHELYFYFEFLGVPESYQNLAILQLFWRKNTLQRSFFERFHAENLTGNLSTGTHVIAYYPGDDRIFTRHPDTQNLKDFCLHAYNNQIARKSILPLSTGNYTAVALRGLNLDRVSMLYLLPLNSIEATIYGLQLQMAALAAAFLLLTFMMFRFLASQFLNPVSEIKNAISSIDHRDFSYRLTIDASKEFNELAQTFNATLETLKDLETARIVQENLFPARETDLGRLRLVAYSQPFSRIGGDCYDFFPTAEKTLGIFIGDVSGHGITAALIMAMAKAALIDERSRFSGIEKLADALDQTIFMNRKSGTKEYMTGLFLTVDSETGECLLINRGHCRPMRISSDGGSIEHVTSAGLPLGYNAPEQNKTVRFRLTPGEMLCLYTDGMAEAQGGNGAALGYEGLRQMLQACWSDKVDLCLQALLQSHGKWATKQDDDQTVILVKWNS